MKYVANVIALVNARVRTREEGSSCPFLCVMENEEPLGVAGSDGVRGASPRLLGT